MKKVIYSFGLVFAMIMTACSSEDQPARPEMPAEGIHASLTLSLPTGGSRSETITPPNDGTNSDGGAEVGKDYENNVNSVLVILAKNNGTATEPAPEDLEFIAAGQADANPVVSAQRPTYNVRFYTGNMLENANKDVYVFAYCNPTAHVLEQVAGFTPAEDGKAGSTFADLIYTLEGASSSIWAKNSFLMTNRDLQTKTLPSEEEMKKSTRQNPIDLGTVNVQRVAARFDFEQTTMPGQLKPNYYPIKNWANNNSYEGYVEMVGMSLFNLSKTFYYLPRMSATAAWTPSVLCQREIPSNWVVSTNYDLKSEYNGTDASADYFFPTSVDGFAPKTMKYDLIADLFKDDSSADDDNDEGWVKPNGATNYKIWRYATENTIPGVNEQKHGITTGVLFKGYIRPMDGSELAGYMQAKKVLYAFDGHIYGDKDALNTAAEAAPATSVLNVIYTASFVAGNIDENGDLKKTEVIDGQGFTIYRPDTEGNYPCYYYYYNRHNDNNNNVVMGDMEFAVVRNNVYKLKINTVNEFGHPGDPGDDPDPEKPGDPDESPKTYFKLSVQVLPWVVRINNIEF